MNKKIDLEGILTAMEAGNLVGCTIAKFITGEFYELDKKGKRANQEDIMQINKIVVDSRLALSILTN